MNIQLYSTVSALRSLLTRSRIGKPEAVALYGSRVARARSRKLLNLTVQYGPVGRRRNFTFIRHLSAVSVNRPEQRQQHNCWLKQLLILFACVIRGWRDAA